MLPGTSPLSKHGSKVTFEEVVQGIDAVDCRAELLLLNLLVVVQVQQVLAVLYFAVSQPGQLLAMGCLVHASLHFQQVLRLVLRVNGLCDGSHPGVLVGADMLQPQHPPLPLVIVVAVAHLNFIRTITNDSQPQLRRNWQLTPVTGSDSHFVRGFRIYRHSSAAELSTLTTGLPRVFVCVAFGECCSLSPLVL